MKAIIFDFFGVIHDDPLKLWLRDQDRSTHIQAGKIAREFDLGRIGMNDFTMELSNASGQTPESILGRFALADLNYNTVELIEELGENYPIALLSNAHTDELEPILDRHNLRRLFDHMVISSEVGMAKPDAEIFVKTLDVLGVEPHEALFLDDSQQNIEAARSIGMNAIHYTYTNAAAEQLHSLGVLKPEINPSISQPVAIEPAA